MLLRLRRRPSPAPEGMSLAPIGITLHATATHWGRCPRESETRLVRLLNAKAVLLCLHHPSTRPARSTSPWASSESQFLTHLLCLSLCLFPSATFAFMVLAWVAYASPSVQSHMLPKRTAKSTRCSAARLQPWRLV